MISERGEAFIPDWEGSRPLRSAEEIRGLKEVKV